MQFQNETQSRVDNQLNSDRAQLKEYSFGSYEIERQRAVERSAVEIVRPSLNTAGEALTQVSEEHNGLNEKAGENHRRAYYKAISEGLTPDAAKAVALEAEVYSSNFSSPSNKEHEVARDKQRENKDEPEVAKDLSTATMFPGRFGQPFGLEVSSQQTTLDNLESLPPLERLRQGIFARSTETPLQTPYGAASNSIRAAVQEELASKERKFSWVDTPLSLAV